MRTDKDDDCQGQPLSDLMQAALQRDEQALQSLVEGACAGNERALDALIGVALRLGPAVEGDLPDLDDLAALEASLSDADFQAVEEALGEDFIERLLAIHLPEGPARRRKARPSRRPLAGSMHRSEGDGELTDKAREEMERKVRELEAEDENKEPGGGVNP